MRPQLAVHLAAHTPKFPTCGDEDRATKNERYANYHGKRGQAEAGPRQDHDARDSVDDRNREIRGAPLGFGEDGDEAHHACHDQPNAEDERKHDERVEGFLDEHEPGDRAERTDQGEEPTGFSSPPKIDARIATTPSNSRRIPMIAVKVLRVSCGETMKNIPTPNTATPNSTTNHHRPASP